MDPKYYPLPRMVDICIDPILEQTLCTALILPAGGLRGKMDFMVNNWNLIKDKLTCIATSNTCTDFIINYWKQHNMPPAGETIQLALEHNGDESGLAHLKGVLFEIMNPDGSPKKNSIPSDYFFIGIIDRAIEETQKNYVQYTLQKAMQICGSGVVVEIGKRKETLKGFDDFIAYNTYATNNLPSIKNHNLVSNSYKEAGTLNYLAYPYLAIGDTVLLVGPSTVGKTMSILDSMTSTFTGNKIFGRLEIMQDHSIYLFTELSASSIKERLQGINKQLDTSKTRIFCLPDIGDIKNYQIFFTKMIQYSEIPKLIYIDNISSWLKVDLNKDQDMAEMHTFFRHLAIATNSCIIELCHTRKRSNNRRDWGEKQLDDIAGSRLLYSLADAVLLFDEVMDEKKKRIRSWGSIDYFKRKDLTRSYYNIDEVAGVIQYHDDLPISLLASDEDKMSNDLIVLNTIKASNMPIGRKDIETITGLTTKTTQRILKMLKETDQIWQHGDDHAPNVTYTVKLMPPKTIDPEQLLRENLGDL